MAEGVTSGAKEYTVNPVGEAVGASVLIEGVEAKAGKGLEEGRRGPRER